MGSTPTQIIAATRIKPLSLQLANQIAAGEVVERPASVVKELLENAIDAGAGQISIDIERGGVSLIRIADNGQGIVKQDLSLAVTRHATSKLHSLKELEQVNSLGFRGEALASISAVSRLSIKSLSIKSPSMENTSLATPSLSKRGSDDEQAWMIDTGTDNDFANYTAEPEPVSHPRGTTIEVRDLFFNTPARRKFLRSLKTEFRHIDEIVKRIALSRFNIAFKLSHNNKIVKNLPKAVTDKAIVQRISKLLSPDFIQHAYRVDFSAKNFTDSEHLRLWGWVTSPQLERKQPDWQLFYVNGRFIRDKLVNHALRQVFQNLLAGENYPAYLLYLEIDPAQVDVNVHPTKHEVRFRQTRLVHDFIYSALNQALSSGESAGEEPSARVKEPSAKVMEPSAQINEPSARVNEPPAQADNQSADQAKTDQHSVASGEITGGGIYSTNPRSINPRSINPGIAEKGEYFNRFANHTEVINENKVNAQLQGLKALYQKKAESAQPGKQKGSFFGQYLSCIAGEYLLTQQDDRLFVIDIARALQGIFESLFNSAQKKSILIPQSVSVEPLKLEQLLSNQSLLSQWGMDISQIGPDAVLFRTLPAMPFLLHCEIDIELFMRSWQAVMPAVKLEANQQDDGYKLFKQCLKAALCLSSITTESLLEVKQQLERVINTDEYCPGSQSDEQQAWAVIDGEQLKALFTH